MKITKMNNPKKITDLSGRLAGNTNFKNKFVLFVQLVVE